MHLRLANVALAAIVAAVLLTGCAGSTGPGESAASPQPDRSVPGSGTGPSSSSGSAAPAPVVRVRVTGVVAEGLSAPWGLAFLPDGSALVSERDTARIRRVSPTGDVRTVGRVRSVDGGGEGGLLGLALSPAYADDSTLFAYFTAGSQNVVARLTYDEAGLRDQRTVLDGIPAGQIHNGGRIAFGPDGYLYVGTGESGRTEASQDPDDLGGKILRITAEGEPAPGNPVAGSPVWSLGHRNVQGLAWDARGRLWAAEFGQNTWDELNRVVPGGNYGWPEVEGRTGDPGAAGAGDFRDPARQWATDKASPSGITVASGSVFMAGLRGERLWQIPLRSQPGARTAKPRALLTGRYGRLRTVEVAPDGSMWLVTSNTDGRGDSRDGDDRILRLTVTPQS